MQNMGFYSSNDVSGNPFSVLFSATAIHGIRRLAMDLFSRFVVFEDHALEIADSFVIALNSTIVRDDNATSLQYDQLFVPRYRPPQPDGFDAKLGFHSALRQQSLRGCLERTHFETSLFEDLTCGFLHGG